jgi:hypothetical protein
VRVGPAGRDQIGMQQAKPAGAIAPPRDQQDRNDGSFSGRRWRGWQGRRARFRRRSPAT